jgi:hypothetical protein
MRTYLVGRQNQRQPCDIALPESELSVSRKHMELSITDDGRLYVVHLHPRNITSVQRNGTWMQLTQDYVKEDEPLLLGKYETTARKLLSLAASVPSSKVPESGTLLKPRPSRP